MKKLIIALLIIEIINIVLIVLFEYKNNCRSFALPDIDTSYNKVQIDSVQLNITKVESTIVELNKQFENESNKINNLSNDSSLLLFRELLQKH